MPELPPASGIELPPVPGSRQVSRSRRSYQCTECGLVLARPSHLARHVDSCHLLPSQRSQFPCPICTKTFNRNDVLLRHIRSTHNLYTVSKRSATKSCCRCIAKKLKCDRVQPCQNCVKSNSPCDYVTANIPFPPIATSITNFGAFEHLRKSETESPHVQLPEQDEPEIPPSSISQVEAVTNHGPESTHQETRNMPSLEDSDSCIEVAPPPAPSWPSPDLSNFDGSMSFAEFDDAIFPPESGENTMRYVPGDLDWRNINFDWLDFGISDNADIQPEAFNSSQFGPKTPPVVPPPSLPSFSSLPSLPPFQSLPSLPRDPNTMSSGTNTPPISDMLDQSTAQQWPFDQIADSAPRKYDLPPLRNILKDTLRPSEPPNMTETIVQLMSKSYLPRLKDIHDPVLYQGVELLQRLVNLYLVEFNPILPMIHAATFNIETCPTVLIAAMTCIGALFSDEPDVVAKSALLSDICNSAIAWLGGSDSANYQDLAYLSASCLHQIYSLGSGNRQLYQNADRSRGMLMGSLRGINLLGSRLTMGSQNSDRQARPSSDPDALHTEWLRWRDREREIRLVWSSFEYDCSLCTLTNRRGAVDLSDLPAKLPCSETLWNAPSAQAWKALQAHIPYSDINPPFPEVLRENVAGKGVPSELSPWSKRLCAQVLGRSLWDLKQLQILSMSDFLGLPSLLAAQRQSKSALLSGLTALGDSMADPKSVSDLIHYNITGLICHYSHLYSAEDTMDLVIFLTRSTAGPRSQKAEIDLAFAQRRLESILADDLQLTRSLVWHAAQIIAIANMYVVSAPCEILRIFMGYTFIMAVARHCPQVSTAYGPNTLIRLDSLETPKTQVTSWIQHGGPSSIGTSGDFCTSQGIMDLGQQAKALLQRMRFWGLAERFTRILANMEELSR